MGRSNSDAGPPGPNVLVIRGLGTSPRGRAVHADLDLDVAAGEVVTVHGAPDSGKGLLLRLITGATRPERGTVSVFGLDPVRRSRAVLRRVGCVPAEMDLWGWLRPAELFAFLAPHYPDWDEDLAEDLLEEWAVPRVRIRAMARDAAARLQLIAAVAFRPGLLLLDTPRFGADQDAGAEVLTRTLQILQEHRGAVLCAHAGPAPAGLSADRSLRLGGGRIVAAAADAPC
jgi:ABC-2 type transport system ATP-binding protein